MPLMKRKSDKAFEHNLKAEMHAGKPQPRALAIAYSVKRKAKKASGGTVESGSKDMNYADGGYLEGSRIAGDKGTSKQGRAVRQSNVSKYAESHPEFAKDSKFKSSLELMNSAKNIQKNKPRLAEGGNVTISAKSEKRPMPSDKHGDSDETRRNSGDKPSHNDSWTGRPTVKQAQKPSITRLSEPRMVESGVIRTKLRRDEHDLMSEAAPASDKEQPSRTLDEEDATKEGKSPDMAKPHTTAKAYAEGGHVELEYGKGPEEDEELGDSPLDGLDDEETMPVDEFMSTNRMSPMLAEGGHIEEDMDNYADDGHEDSIAAAIMSRRNRLHDEVDSGAHDEDLAAAYADGGEVDLSINHDEEPNNEDQMSFQALKKENYNSSNLDTEQPEDSNMKGDSREDDEENKHDMVSSIMSKMKSRKQFKR